MATAKKAAPPGLRYTEPQRREVLRILRMRAAGDVDYSNPSILMRYKLQPDRMADYLKVWGEKSKEDYSSLLHLPGEASEEPQHEVLS